MTDSFQRIVRRVLPINPRSKQIFVGQSQHFQLSRLLERLGRNSESELRVPARRPDDLLVFDLRFDNLRIERSGAEAAKLVRVDSNRRGILIVEFPPQSFGEQAYLERSPNPQSQPNPVGLEANLAAELPLKAGFPKNSGPTLKKNSPPFAGSEDLRPLPTSFVRMSGASRLAFVMPADSSELLFTLEAVLQAMRTWPQNLDISAYPDSGPDFDLLIGYSKILNQELLAGFSGDKKRRVEGELVRSARRVAELGAGGLLLELSTGESAGVSSAVWEAIRKESVALFDAHPELTRGDLHSATLGSLALMASNDLVGMARGLLIDDEITAMVDSLPYVPLLRGTPHPPSQNCTALELPYRIILSPIGAARWRHAIDATSTSRGGRSELWHTRLGDDTFAFGVETPSRIRALWSPDFDDPQIEKKVDPPRPFRMSLDAQDRKLLVKLMAQWNQKRADNGRPYRPRSAEAKRLHLSSLGALIDAGGDWDPRPDGVDLEQWRHLGTLGRDHYVRVVYSGFLVPFGHAASLVKVTERKFESLPKDSNNRVAVLRQRFFLIIRERVRAYDGSEHVLGGRNFPFREIEILTRVTPDLDAPSKLDKPTDVILEEIWAKIYTNETTARMAFLPHVGKKAFRFEIAATDRFGRRVGFSMPLLFISEVINKVRGNETQAFYNMLLPIENRQAELGGASIGFDAESPADTQLATRTMNFRAGAMSRKPSATQANFYPEMEMAFVCVPALQKLLGRNDPIWMTYPKVLKQDDFVNAGQVFLWVDKAESLPFGGQAKEAQTDALGGLASPTMQILGLSRLSGPVSGDPIRPVATALAQAISNRFDPSDFFRGATLLGGINLADIVRLGAGSSLEAGPKFRSEQTASGSVTAFDWSTAAKTSAPLPADALFIASPDSMLVMSGTVTTSNGVVRRESHAELNNFKLNLFGCIILSFDTLIFDSRPGQKPDISVQMHQKDGRDSHDAVMFGGELEFINDLRSFIPSNGFSDPPALSVTPSGISATYSLGLPSIGVGIFALSNVTLGAGFSLPFDNRPVSVRFNFAERQRPFSLTVAFLGGGGFFATAVGAKGVQEIEASLEFGAGISLTLAVASGMVEIKAGVYFSWKDDGASPKRVILAGFVRIHGELTIVCIFSASLTFNLQLGYERRGIASLVFGEAELIVEVEVLLLSFSVPVRCRREFGGSEADPKFLDLIPDQPTWNDYCAAFAPELV